MPSHKELHRPIIALNETWAWAEQPRFSLVWPTFLWDSGWRELFVTHRVDESSIEHIASAILPDCFFPEGADHAAVTRDKVFNAPRTSAPGILFAYTMRPRPFLSSISCFDLVAELRFKSKR